MMCQSRVMAALMIALVGAGCATMPPYNPFKIAEDDFYRRVKTIALAPVVVPASLENPEPVQTTFEALIAGKLQEAGFSTVPSSEVAEIWKRLTAQVGEIFDRVTGQRDEAKFKTVQEYVRRELNRKFDADALLYPAIRPVTARATAGKASWHGNLETMSYSHYGAVTALSLIVTIEDIYGVTMYANAGGIQLVQKAVREQLLSPPKLMPVPRNELFANREQNMAAVNIALAPLITKSGPTEAPKEKL